MGNNDPQIEPVRRRDVVQVGKILCRGLAQGDPAGLPRLVALSRRLGCLLMPLALQFVGNGYKAVWHGHIVGCAYVEWRKRSGYVFNVAVDPAYRRQGIARQLMRHLADLARARERQWLGLYVERENVAAQRLYESEGYFRYGSRVLHRSDPLPLPAPDVAVTLRDISYRAGAEWLRFFRTAELAGGSGRAAAVVGGDYPTAQPPTGRFWIIGEEAHELGVAWCHGSRDRARPTAIHLWLDEECWGDRDVVLSVARALGDRGGIDIEPGSDGHFAALLPVLAPLGFIQREHAQLLMLKELP
jgi:ribosomal protein S18 acetylase RimI-like enzyme